MIQGNLAWKELLRDKLRWLLGKRHVVLYLIQALLHKRLWYLVGRLVRNLLIALRSGQIAVKH